MYISTMTHEDMRFIQEVYSSQLITHTIGEDDVGLANKLQLINENLFILNDVILRSLIKEKCYACIGYVNANNMWNTSCGDKIMRRSWYLLHRINDWCIV